MSDGPSLCAQCLGDKDHIKMIRQPGGEECKLCTRPFTVYRWNILRELRQLQKTIICNTCANARNCCQSCMVDVTYGIPLDIRDAALKMAGLSNEYAVESSSRNREVKAIMADKLEAKAKQNEQDEDKMVKAKAILQTLASKLSATKRNVAKERAVEISKKDTTKIVTKLPFGGTLSAPEDKTIKSFFIFGFSPDMPQYVLSNYCETFGSTSLIKVVHRARCAYVTFTARKDAESFANSVATNGLSKNPKTAGLVVIDGKYPVRVSWGAPKSLGTTNDEHKKIGLVVANVLKQLAERDSAPAQKRKKTEKSKTYKAASGDMEI